MGARRALLQEQHRLSLPFFETVLFISQDPTGSRRVGDLAADLHITVGGMSKLVDRVAAAGLIDRTPDPDDRRASRAALTDVGRRTLDAAIATYDAAVAALLDQTLSAEEQREMHTFISRLLTATAGATPMSDVMRAAVVQTPGGPEVLEVREVPRPVPAPGWAGC